MTPPMMDMPLLIQGLLTHAARFHGATRIFSAKPNGDIHETHWSSIDENARRIAGWLGTQGLMQGDRVATLAWNTHRHLELYFAVPGAGHVCHTLNPRLHADDLVHIINDAADQVLFFDADLADLVAEIRPRLTTVKTFVALCAPDQSIAECISDVLFFDTLTGPAFDWPELDERAPALLCYTSGTTGRPKGVLYTHRSTVLHTLACNQPDGVGLSAQDVLLPVVPMFHVNAWGTPFMAAAVGASLALPGPRLDGESLIKLINRTKATHALGVPTIWMGLLEALGRSGARIDTMTRCIIGGAAMSPSLMAAYRDIYGVELLHGWGMTEMSPVGTINRLLSKHASLDQDAQDKVRHAQGRPPYGVDMRVVDEDGTPLPRDGASIGALHVRGPWIVDGYFQTEVSACTDDGWFDTGDIASIDADGYMHIHDRAKDVIKSGGEWISTVALENIAMSHPGIKQAAAIAVPHPKWDERPVLVVVADAPEADILAHFAGKVAKWQIPDRVMFVEALPLGSTGKVLKTELRQTFAKLFESPNNA